MKKTAKKKKAFKKLQGAELIRKIMSNIVDQERDLDINLMDENETQDVAEMIDGYLEGTGWTVEVHIPEPVDSLFIIK